MGKLEKSDPGSPKRSKGLSGNPLIKNFLSVSFIQGLGMALPLITIPYLLTTIGADGFGVISFALAYTTFFVVFTDYGYNLLGTREVALHRDNPEKVSSIFSTMLSAQFFLTLIAALLFALSVWLIPDFRKNWEVFAMSFGIVLGSTLLPTWFFQGKEHFATLNWIQFGYRALYTIGIFVMVKDQADLLLVPILNSSTSILGGIIGLFMLLYRYRLRFSIPPFSSITKSLKEGWNLFVSAISTTSLQQMPILILGFFASEAVVGLFSFAEKIILVFRLAIQILSSVLYPRVIAYAKKSYHEAAVLLSKVASVGVAMLITMGILVYYLPDLLEPYKSEMGSDVTAGSLRILAAIPLLVFLKICAQQMLLAFDLTKIYAQIMITSALVNAALLFALIWSNSYTGAAVAMLITELFILLYLRSQWKHARTLNRIS